MARGSWFVFLLLSCACASPASRIRKNQAAFDAYPAPIQDSIRKGEVEVGFTPEQAVLALGEPDRKYTRKDSTETVEVWAYNDFAMRPTLGVGGIFSEGGSMYGTGIGFERSQSYPDDRTRLIFRQGRVSAIESRAK